MNTEKPKKYRKQDSLVKALLLDNSDQFGIDGANCIQNAPNGFDVMAVNAGQIGAFIAFGINVGGASGQA